MKLWNFNVHIELSMKKKTFYKITCGQMPGFCDWYPVSSFIMFGLGDQHVGSSTDLSVTQPADLDYSETTLLSW